jgi:peptidoglycan/xylan/chitin deacetylase (PgdA/CDA1 family)
MIVEPETFQMHLQILKNEFTLISLNEWVQRKINNQSLPTKACAITFDDGWLDNYEYAYPILKKEQVPATLFAVSELIGTNQTFWPNRIQTLLQCPQEQLKQISWLSELISNNDINKELTASVIYSLKHRSDIELIELISLAEEKLDIKPSEKPVLMNLQQLQDLSNSGLVEIGSHTCQHVRLIQGLSPGIYEKEVVNSKKQLEEMIDKPVNLFCYPNGDYCDAAVQEVSKHYDAAVITQKGITQSNNSNIHTLPRFGVHQDTSRTKRQLLAKVANWLV